MLPLTLYINGQLTPAIELYDELPRAIIISLFTWRRAEPDDDLPASNRYGWWGDTYADTPGDKIGSRLWLLSRAKLTNQTVLQAQEYAREALQWLIDDGVASRVDVIAERADMQQLSMAITINRGQLNQLNLRFADVWGFINAG